MTHSDLQPLLGRTLTYLQALARDAVQPDDARAGLRLLEQHDPDHPLDLVWLEEGYDQSLHYDALIRLPGQGTVSLGFSFTLLGNEVTLPGGTSSPTLSW